MPYVHFAWPAETQPCPMSDACWSPATPMIGKPSGRKSSPSVAPNSPALERISANICGGTSNNAQRGLDQAIVRRSMRSVRDALVASVTNCRPPVRCQITKESTVPATKSPASARLRARVT